MTRIDSMNKTPDQTARDFRREKMDKILSSYASMKIGFTQIEHEKLMSGSILDESQMDEKKYDSPMNNQIANLLGSLVAYTEEEAGIRNKKFLAEQEADRIRNEKVKREEEIEQKRISLLIAENFDEINRVNSQFKKE